MAFTTRAAAVFLLAIAAAGCGGRPFAEGGSRELTIVTVLPADSPEVLLLRAVVERLAIRIEDEAAYDVHLAAMDDPGVYRARTVLFVGFGPMKRIPRELEPLKASLASAREPFV